MHNNDSNSRKTANKKHMEALDADYQAIRTQMDEMLDASLSDAEAMTQLLIDLGPIEEIDLGPIEEIDFGPMEEIDFGSSPALDLSEISASEAVATHANPTGNASAADLGGGKLPPGNPPSVEAAEPCDPKPTRHISIRIPVEVLEAARQEANRLGIKYQRLMIEALRLAATQWTRRNPKPGAQVQ